MSSRYHTRESVPAPRQWKIVMFVSIFLACLVMSFFEFFTTVISFYDICHLHLNPNSVLMLSIFAHLCENFIGVKP